MLRLDKLNWATINHTRVGFPSTCINWLKIVHKLVNGCRSDIFYLKRGLRKEDCENISFAASTELTAQSVRIKKTKGMRGKHFHSDVSEPSSFIYQPCYATWINRVGGIVHWYVWQVKLNHLLWCFWAELEGDKPRYWPQDSDWQNKKSKNENIYKSVAFIPVITTSESQFSHDFWNIT